MLEVIKDTEKGYRFLVKSSRGHTLLESVVFQTEADARREMQALKPLVKDSVCFERKTDHNGRFQFSIKDNQGQVIGNSQLYRSEAGMENGIKNTRSRIISS